MSYREDGDPVSAVVLAELGDDIRAAANAVGSDDVAPGAMSHRHLPGLLEDSANLFPNGLSGGFTRYGTAPASPFVNYQNFLVTTPYDYQVFHNVAPTAPYGASGAAGEGWRIPQNPGTSERGSIITSNSRIDTFGYAGVHLSGSINIGSVSGDGYFTSGGGVASLLTDVCVLVGLGWTDGGGVRHVAEDSIRAAASKNKVQRQSVQYFLRQADLNLGDGKMQEVFLVVQAAGMRSFYGFGFSGLDSTYSIAGCTISALPLHAGVL